MNTVIHLLLRMIIGPEHVLVHISAGMTLEFSYLGRKRPLSNFSGRKQTGISICLTLGVTLLASTIQVQLLLSYQCVCTVGSPVCSANVSVSCCHATSTDSLTLL